MKLAKRFVVGLLGLLMVAMVAMYLTPLDAYVPEVEKAVSGQLQEPVSIRHLRLAVLPIPHLELQDVQVGERGKIAVRSVDVEPNWLSFLMGRKVVRRIVLKNGAADLMQVRRLVDWYANTPVTAQSVLMRELQLSGMNLTTPEMTLGPIEGKVEFTQAGQLERAWFAANERKVTATVLPQPGKVQQGRQFAVQMQARGWVIPQIPQLPVDDLQLLGVLCEKDFIAQKFAVASRGMRMAGFGKAEFTDGWRGRAIMTRMEAPLEQLMALAGRTVKLTGALSATGEFSASAANLIALKDNFLFAGDVSVSRAAVQMAAHLRHPLLVDEIRMRVAVQPEHWQLSALEARLYGGKLSGMASINRKENLLTAELAASGIAMQPVVQAFTNKLLFTGSMAGAGRFSMRLDALERFPEGVQANGNFHLVNGVLTNMDLLQAARNPGKVYAMGGATRFDDLTGLFTVDGDGYHVRKLKIVSGSLNAEGKVDISPALQLGGMLDVDVKRTIGLVSMPMAVSGTLDNPVIQPEPIGSGRRGSGDGNFGAGIWDGGGTQDRRVFEQAVRQEWR